MGTSIEQLILASSLIVLVGILAVRVSHQFGLPTLLAYLGLGMILGESVLGFHFSDAELARTIGLSALVVILAEGGLTTRWTTVRRALAPGGVLATVGIAVSIVVVAAAGVLLLDLSWRDGVILGAMISSTDAAAVFSTLRRLPLRGRDGAILEAESGFNDAPAVILVVLLSGHHTHSVLGTAALMVYELGIGIVVGVLVGVIGALVLRRSSLPVAGLYPLATIAFCVLAFASTSLLGASGFLAVYLTGLVLGNADLPHRQAAIGFAEGLAWLAQIALFVLLGLLVSPRLLPEAILPALAIGAVLLLIARPLSVVVSTAAFRLGWRSQAFLSWAGLRGAVPIVLATIPITAGLPQGVRLFNIVFVLVVVFTLIQGWSLPWFARLLGVVDTEPAREVMVESAPLEELAADLLHVRIGPESRMHGVYVSELRLPEGAVLSLVVRAGSSLVPDPATRLEHDDELLLVTTRRSRPAAEARLRAISRAGRLARWYENRPEEPAR